MLTRLHPLVFAALALLLGVVGWLAATTAGHLWTDHAALHQIWDLELRRAQAAQGAQGAPPSLPPAPAAPDGGS